MGPATINKPNILGVAMDKLFDLRAQILAAESMVADNAENEVELNTGRVLKLAAAGAYDLIQQINETESATDQLQGNFPDEGDPQQLPDLDAHKRKSIRSMG